MKVTVVWKDGHADTTWYFVDETTFVPSNGPYQFLKITLEDESDLKIIFIDVNGIERIYYEKIPKIV